MKSLIVNEKFSNKKLNTFLLENINNLSSNLFYKALRKKDIKVNGRRISQNITVFSGDKIDIYISDDLLSPQIDVNIFFEDDNILIINKPYNLEITGENSLTSIVHNKYKYLDFKPMPCHRLDRNTSGLIIFAKSNIALNILLEKFKNHEIEKHYLALVYGIPKEKHRRVVSFLFKDSKKSKVYICDYFKPGYKKIITSYSVLEERNNNTCILDIEIETGKTHQIRAHLAYLGLPIIGDR